MRKKGRDIPAELAHIAEGIQDSGTTRQEASSLLRQWHSPAQDVLPELSEAAAAALRPCVQSRLFSRPTELKQAGRSDDSTTEMSLLEKRAQRAEQVS